MAKIDMRAWSLDAGDYPDDVSFREAVQAELVQSEYLSYRLGIAIVSAPIRAQRVPGGEFETVGWTFRTATVPAIRYTEDVAAAADEVADAAEEALDAEPEAEPAAEFATERY